MPSYHVFTTTTQAGLLALNRAVRAFDPTAAVAPVDGGVQVKKEPAWTAPQLAAAQTVIDGAADPTPAAAAQFSIDTWPIEYKALALALIDALNVLRTHAAIGLPAITPQQAIAAIRAKAGTL